MKSITKLTVAIVLALCVGKNSNAQITIGATGDDYLNTVSTAVPFLRIAPDARSGGMADVGIAISPDANSIFWNASKLAFVEDNSGLSITYTPWLRNLVNDIYLAYLTGFWKVDDLSTLGASLRYFSLGSITFTDASGNILQDFRPNEFAFDVAYARKLADKLSAGLNLKYIYSNLATGQYVNGIPIKPANGVAADVSLFYTTEFNKGDKDSYLNAGVNISNIGNKITYTNSIEKDFIPTNLGLGVTYGINFDEHNEIAIALDFNKLLVPTPDSTDANGNTIFDYKEQGVVSGIFSSFGDAPRGFSEEIKEIVIAAGIEYWYSDQFAVRTGYFYEAAEKGNRKFFTVGLGLKYNVFGLDFSYLIPSGNQQNPLDNTLRFTLAFDFASLKTEGGEDAKETDM
ncbi:MAG: type IX secretion system outer membrane channel protein PorV [Fimbriimonadaceae bacterium]|nr:type IX secretion system outer membrane channel protein PorV [Chitinophagales bacterium]